MNSKIKQTVRALVALISCLVLTAQAAEDGLVAHFTFDDATQFGYDSVQKKVIGEIVSANYSDPASISAPVSCEAPFVRGMQIKDTAWYQTSCMSVPGTSFGSAQGIPYNGQDVTYSLWIKPATKWQTGSALGLGTICFLLRHAPLGKEWWGDNAHAHIYIAKGENDFPKIVFNVGKQLEAVSSATYQLAGSFDGNWHFVVASYSNKVLTLYYDGNKVATKEDCGMYVPNNSPLTLGAVVTASDWDSYSQRRYLGGLDDVKVYGRTLTDDEVLAAYQKGATAHDTDVISWSGAAAGGAVEDEANWETESNRRTLAEIYAAGAVFDATSLQEAGVLTHDTAATLNLKGVICSNGQDEVTLQMKQGALAMKRPSTQRGLVAHLSFDDPDDMLRDSGTAELQATSNWWMDSSHTGEAVPNQSVEGVSGKALYFPGNGEWSYWPSPYVRTSPATTTKANGIPKGGETVTYSLWIKPYALGLWNNGMMGLANNGPIWIFRRGDWGNGGATYLWLQKGDKNGRLYWSISNYMDNDGTCTYDPTNLFDGNWHHVVCVYDAKVLALYYDGVKVATTEASYALNLTDGRAIFLGRSNEGTNANENYRRYLGGFDEFKVFNVALTDAEVAAEYAQFSKTLEMTGTTPSPVKLQLDAGTTADVRGYFEYGSLFGAGSMFVGPASLLKLDGTFGLSGALTGCGPVTVANLVLGGDTDDYTGDFTIAENAKITVSDANGTMLNSTFGGKVILPKKATIAWGARPDAGEATLTAATLVPPTDFTEWVDSTGKGVRVKVVGNQLKIKIRTGLVLVVQ